MSLVWCKYMDEWWPAIQTQEPEEAQGIPEDNTFVLFSDGSGMPVPITDTEAFDPEDASKQSQNPQIAEAMVWAKGHYDAAIAATTQEIREEDFDGIELTAEDGEKKEKKSKKDKKDKKDKKSKKEKKDDEESEDEEEKARRKKEKKEKKAAEKEAKKAEKAAKKAAKKAKKEAGEHAGHDSDESDEDDDASDHGKKIEQKLGDFSFAGAEDFAGGDDDDGLFDTGVSAGFGSSSIVTTNKAADWTPVDIAMEAVKRTGNWQQMHNLRRVYAEVRNDATQQGLLMVHGELDLLRYFEKKLGDNSRILSMLTTEKENANDRGDYDSVTECKRLISELDQYDPVKELKGMRLTMAPPQRMPPKRMMRRFRYRDPMMGPTDLPTLEEEPIGDIELALRSSAPIGSSTQLNGKSSTTIDPLHRTGLRHAGVMSNWLATRDLHQPAAKDAQAVAAFGTVPRQYNEGAKKVEARVARRAIQLTGTNPLLSRQNTAAVDPSLRPTKSIAEIDFFDFTIQGINQFHHEDSQMMSSHASQMSELDSIAASEAGSDNGSLGHDSSSRSGSHQREEAVVESEEYTQLPSVSAMWAPLSENDDVKAIVRANTETDNLVALSGPSKSSNAPTPKSRGSTGEQDKPKVETWRGKARYVISKALTPFLKGTHNKPKVLNEESFQAAAQEVLTRVHGRVLQMNKRPGSTQGDQLLASDMDESTEAKIFASAVHYVDRHYVKQTAGSKRRRAERNNAGGSEDHSSRFRTATIDRDSSNYSQSHMSSHYSSGTGTATTGSYAYTPLDQI